MVPLTDCPLDDPRGPDSSGQAREYNRRAPSNSSYDASFPGRRAGGVNFSPVQSTPATGATGTMNPPRGEGGADPAPDRLADGWPGISFGLGVSPLRSQFGLAAPQAATGVQGGEPAGLLDPEGKALSFDLKLGWPGTDKFSLLEPYVKLGPALFIVEPDYVSRLVGAQPDPSYRLGAKAAPA